MGHLRHSGGSLLLVNVHVVPQGPLRERIKGLLREARDGSLPFRLLMTSEQSVNDFEAKLTLLKVPPVRAHGSGLQGWQGPAGGAGCHPPAWVAAAA